MRTLLLIIVLLAGVAACAPSAAPGQRSPSFSEVSAAASGQSSSSSSRQAQPATPPVSPITPFMFIFPVVAFVVGLFGSRGGRGPIGVFVTLGLAFFNVVTTTNRVGRFDIVGTVLVPALIIAAFVVGMAIRFVLRGRI